MADFSALKTAIQANIRTNANEEITGAILQEILLSMVTTMGDGAINGLVTALQAEITNRQNAVSGEATNRAEADSELSGRINAEATARGEADTQLSNSITAITTRLNEGYVYAGIATPSTNPGTPTGKVFYIALQAGTYTNFSSLSVTQGITILKYNGTAWSQEQLVGIDDVPTAGSDNLVKSGGVYKYIAPISSYVGEMVDILHPNFNTAIINKLGLVNGEKYHIHVDFSSSINYLWLCLTDDLSGWDTTANTNITIGNADVAGGVTSFDADFVYDNSKWLKYACQTNLTVTPFIRILISRVNDKFLRIDREISAIKFNKEILFNDPYPYYMNHDGSKSDRDSEIVKTTSPIKVNEGDVFIYTGGYQDAGLTLIGGYTDIECNFLNGFTQLLTSGQFYKDTKITIPSGVNYIIAWSKLDRESYLYQKGSIFDRLAKVEDVTKTVEAKGNAFDNSLNGYIINESGALATNPDTNFKVSAMISVNRGDTLFFNGGWQNQPVFNMIWGYSDKDMNNPIAIYPCVLYARYVTCIVPDGVKYVRAWSYSYDYEEHRLYFSTRNPKDVPPTVLRYNTSSGSFLLFLQSKISNPSLFNRYVIEVEDGEYDLTSDAITQTYGIKLPNYTKLVGLNGNQNVKFKVVLTEYDDEVCTLSLCRDCEIEGITFEGTKTRYTIHDDFAQDGIIPGNSYPYIQIFKNCVFRGVDNKMKTTFGSGIKAGARWYFENCEFITDTEQAFLWHTNNNFDVAGELTMINCKFTSPVPKGGIVLRSLVSGKINKVHLFACNTTGFNFKPDGTTPDAYPDYTVDGAGNSRNATVVVEGTNFEGFTTDFSDVEN